MQKLYLTILLAPLLFLNACDARDAQGCADVFAKLIAIDGNKGGNSPGGITKISIVPDTVTVKPGCTFFIKNDGNHDLTIVPDDSGADWLKVTTPQGNLVSKAAKKTDPKSNKPETFKYKIIVKGVGELDPRARVL